MSRLTGLAITGLAIYLAVNSLPDYNSRSDHDAAVAIATDNPEGIARDAARMVEAPRSFSSSNPLISQEANAQEVARLPLKEVSEASKTAENRVQPVVADAHQSREQITGETVQLASVDDNNDIKPVMLKQAVITPPKPEDVLRETQRELKRVGCYRYRVDGIWGKGSRSAFRQFVKRSNAISRNIRSRLSDMPDPAVLEILRKTSKRICGRPCAHGKMLAANGRCINDPVIMARLKPVNPWDTNAAVDPGFESDAALAAKKAAAARAAKIARKRKARRKWRARRYALGGPVYGKRQAKRGRYRYVRRYKRNWRQRVWYPD